ncbi:hypothetical protein [Phyllobacterium lublinensis]|uniref:hypothetical protein n=1 Tax=Phyllobacterium lublinensis TaxID=2875708 RepID=UPI001CCDD608|nr:hypothetical protein [Phyllobacterium sp. 2063]MBZ9653815.1 hypothetical protein [Phyllobacterium sp. 2063]
MSASVPANSASRCAVKMHQCRILFTMLIALLAIPALAQEPTFAELQAMCSNTKDSGKYGYCVGFLEAVALRVVQDHKNCTLLKEYIDSPNSKIAIPDLIADLNPKEYQGGALASIEKYFLNKGCM